MDFQISPELHKKLKKIKHKDKTLTLKIEKQLAFFQKNHLHSPLRVHKLSGNLDNIWSISIDNDIRMLFLLEEDEAYFFDIGTHDQVYKK